MSSVIFEMDLQSIFFCSHAKQLQLCNTFHRLLLCCILQITIMLYYFQRSYKSLKVTKYLYANLFILSFCNYHNIWPNSQPLQTILDFQSPLYWSNQVARDRPISITLPSKLKSTQVGPLILRRKMIHQCTYVGSTMSKNGT